MLLLTTFWQQTHAEIRREYAITDMVYARINMKGGLGYIISVNTFVALLLFEIFHIDERS